MARKATKRAPTMHDVAHLAGVSQTTVSFVLNDVPTANIPEGTRTRVWDAVRELGYRTNAAAKLLRTSKSHLIGFVTDEIASTPFAGRVVAGAQERAWEHKKLLLVINTDSQADIEAAAFEMLLERQVEGIIYAAMYHRLVVPTTALAGLPAHVPVVLLNCYVDDRSLPSVVPDEIQGARTATERLLQKGHRRIGFINDVGLMQAAFGRLDGYKQALEAYGVPFDPGLVRAATSNAPEGYRCARELLQLPAPPTALFCFNDSLAMGAYEAVKQLGLTIPGDVAIVGFDNLQIIAAQLQPLLTTMDLPHYEMGQWAVQHLLDHDDGSPSKPIQHRIPCRLIDRASV